MTDDKQDPSVVVLNNVIGWLAELDYPGVGTQMQRLSSLTSGLTAMKAELEEALNRAHVAEYKLDQAVNTVQPMIVARAEAAEQERDELREALGERPTMHLRKDSGDPEWQQVNALFERHGLPAPDWRMRDELVGWLVWARYGEKLAGGDK